MQQPASLEPLACFALPQGPQCGLRLDGPALLGPIAELDFLSLAL